MHPIPQAASNRTMEACEFKIMAAEEYLAWGERSETEHEFLNVMFCDVYATIGVRGMHVAVNLKNVGCLFSHTCAARVAKPISDMKFPVEKANVFFCPEVFVTFGEGDRVMRLF
jgi:hypothetical protein